MPRREPTPSRSKLRLYALGAVVITALCAATVYFTERGGGVELPAARASAPNVLEALN